MTKRSAITLGLAVLLGIMTSAITVAVEPRVLRVTGTVLCESGTEFVVREGATVELPENRRGAPVHFACVGRDGEREPNLGASAFVVFVVVTAAWWALLAWAVRRLVAAARPTAN